MNILFLGSQLQSYRCLKYLLLNFKNVNIIAVVPHIKQPPIRTDQNIRDLAKEHNIPIIELNEAKNLKFDLGISLLFDKKIPPDIFNIPARGVINLHLSPLPRFRGANGVLHAIRLARKEQEWMFGVSMHYIDEQIDTGPIIDQLQVPIFEDDTAQTLHARANDSIYTLFVKNIDKILSTKTKISSVQQNNTEPSYTFKSNDVKHEIDLKDSPENIYDQVRALSFQGKPKPFAMIGKYKLFLSLE